MPVAYRVIFSDDQLGKASTNEWRLRNTFISSTLTISLIAMNISGCIDTAYQTIQVLEPLLELELSQ